MSLNIINKLGYFVVQQTGWRVLLGGGYLQQMILINVLNIINKPRYLVVQQAGLSVIEANDSN